MNRKDKKKTEQIDMPNGTFEIDFQNSISFCFLFWFYLLCAYRLRELYTFLHYEKADRIIHSIISML